ncbi:MAG: M28 family peptidase, partial [Elusimicrobia bacterium]|nr:M28 family peptidase [Elusimicrobiota bacterium]
MKNPTLSILETLTAVPTAPFKEGAVSKKALAWLKGLGRRVSVARRRGGWIVGYQGAGPGPALVLAAHLDHPGFHLEAVTKKGCRAMLKGGHPRELLEGCLVEAFPEAPKNNRPCAIGRLGPAPKKGDAFPLIWTRPPENGAKPAFGVLALTPLSVRDGWVASRSIDDLMGCAIALEVLRRTVAKKLKTNLTLFLHRAEEVGFVGALDFARSGAARAQDSIVSLETSRSLPGARPGRGPVIRLGDKATCFDPNLISLLDQAAAALKKRGVAVQRRRLIGGTCEATAYLAYGYETAGVALPLVNYHNGI